jgi:seryl-tRNA synthetase
MPKVTISLHGVRDEFVSQLSYAMAFVAEDTLSHEVDPERNLVVELKPEANQAQVEEKIRKMIERYDLGESGFRSTVYFEQHATLVENETWRELLARRWVTPIGDGHVILRGRAAQLADLIDSKIDQLFVREFKAEKEMYPATIRNTTLDRCAHFTSFPEHIDFVAPLRSDMNVLQEFSASCRDGGWSAGLHDGRMSHHEYAISPSCCYHCYEGMEGWELSAPGRCVTTSTVACHRYEGRNQQSLSRLRAFTMREVVWVGHPKYVLDSRHRADAIIVEWAKDWGLDCTYETANDMFFTDDYAIKASFQRQQEAKKELRMIVPTEGKTIAVFSSNFHSITFGKAFNITLNGRTAASACVAWGYERMVYAIFSQFGFDVEQWPSGLRRDFAAWLAKSGD